MKNVLSRTIILLFILMMAVAVYYNLNNKSSMHGDVDLTAGAVLGGDFSLLDQNGDVFTNDNLNDKYKILFFGFTHCPMICPKELSKMTDILKRFDGDALEKILPIFVTVDPERDDVERLSKYLAMFHPNIIGLTGERAEIDKILAVYGAPSRKIEIEEMEGYMYDHSTYMYFLNQDNELVSLYKMNELGKDIAVDMLRNIN